MIAGFSLPDVGVCKPRHFCNSWIGQGFEEIALAQVSFLSAKVAGSNSARTMTDKNPGEG
jgi:hypothetical protein